MKTLDGYGWIGKGFIVGANEDVVLGRACGFCRQRQGHTHFGSVWGGHYRFERRDAVARIGDVAADLEALAAEAKGAAR